MTWGERDGDKRQDLTEAFIRREILRETKGWLINIPVPIVFSLILLAFLSIPYDGSLAAKLGIGLVASVCAFFVIWTCVFVLRRRYLSKRGRFYLITDRIYNTEFIYRGRGYYKNVFYVERSGRVVCNLRHADEMLIGSIFYLVVLQNKRRTVYNFYDTSRYRLAESDRHLLAEGEELLYERTDFQ